MESNMVNDFFDNQYILDTEEALLIIEDFFNKELKGFTLKNKYNDHSGYWGFEYVRDESNIKIESGKGVLEPSITISNTKYALSQFDKNMKEVKVSSKKNILYTLDVIKHFFND